ncbi:hypothetical protein [Streptomyces sp. STCH 565 A]|uniref:hypothetical protein n=1 Tax=Streptomyces sp. STCH 565 A TaxID=2950532 RepID=UPI00207579DD|nr:hypothetical protein [Streptomyces sp. STCH 565 A]MCM8555341.1 hypothetical protein [Streptomyces sp. STCH 565 A]
MAKESGLGWSVCSVDDASGTPRDIKNDFTNVQIATPRGVQDVTGLDKSAYERILLLADFSFTGNGVFNDAPNMGHDVFKTVTSTSVPRTLTLTVSGQTLANEVLFTDYPLTRADSGELTYSVPGVLCDGTVPTWTTA